MGYQCCPICGKNNFESFLERQDVPVHQNAPAPTAEAARKVNRGNLDICVCQSCGFVFNAAFKPGLMDYSEEYDNTQVCSGFYEAYMDQIVKYLVDKYDLRKKHIVEIGCGKGHFLRSICEYGGNFGLGFDPTYVGPKEVDRGRVRFITEFFPDDWPYENVDVICCRHVLEHIQDPLSLLRTTRSAMDDNSKGLVFFEVPDIQWILRNIAFWDLYYEHCSYFAPHSISYAFSLAGFETLAIKDAFDGQYLWIEAQTAQNKLDSEPLKLDKFLKEIEVFSEKCFNRIESSREMINKIHQAGTCIVWGAGAKGVTLVNIVDPSCELVDYVVDINKFKQGRFIPVSGHRIAGPKDASVREAAGIVVTNPNYFKEIEAEVRSWGKNNIPLYPL